MTRDSKPYDLHSIEPIAPAPDVDEADEQRDRVDRVGLAAAAAAGSTPAVGVVAERMDEAPPESSSDAHPERSGAEADEGDKGTRQSR